MRFPSDGQSRWPTMSLKWEYDRPPGMDPLQYWSISSPLQRNRRCISSSEKPHEAGRNRVFSPSTILCIRGPVVAHLSILAKPSARFVPHVLPKVREEFDDCLSGLWQVQPVRRRLLLELRSK